MKIKMIGDTQYPVRVHAPENGSYSIGLSCCIHDGGLPQTHAVTAAGNEEPGCNLSCDFETRAEAIAARDKGFQVITSYPGELKSMIIAQELIAAGSAVEVK